MISILAALQTYDPQRQHALTQNASSTFPFALNLSPAIEIHQFQNKRLMLKGSDDSEGGSSEGEPCCPFCVITAEQFPRFLYYLLAAIMEELLGLTDEIAAFPPFPKPSRDLGESWEEISQRMKGKLQLQASPSAEQAEARSGRRKFFSEAPSPSGRSSLLKKATVRGGAGPLRAGSSSRARLKIIRTITEDDNIESYRKSLTKRTSTEASPLQLQQERPKLRELKLNSPSQLTSSIKPQAIKSLQSSLKKPVLALKAAPQRSDNGGQGNESAAKLVQLQKALIGSRMGKSHSEAACWAGRAAVARVDILMRGEAESELRMVEKVSHSLCLRRSLHLQEYSHLRENRSGRLPFLSLDHQRQQRDSVHVRNVHKQWLFVQRSLGRPHAAEECKRARERELQARLRRDLGELGKRGKLLATIRPTRLKLFK